MKFRFVRFSRSTAKKNPMMIIREYDRLIQEKENNVKKAKEAFNEMYILVDLKNQKEVVKSFEFPSEENDKTFVVKLKDLQISLEIQKGDSLLPQTMYKTRHGGVDALRSLYKIHSSLIETLENHEKILLEVQTERDNFYLKYITK